MYHGTCKAPGQCNSGLPIVLHIGSLAMVAIMRFIPLKQRFNLNPCKMRFPMCLQIRSTPSNVEITRSMRSAYY